MASSAKDIQSDELKDTIPQLNTTIRTQNDLIVSLQKMLEERNAKDDEKDRIISNLQAQLEYFKQKLFGSSSEQRSDMPGQLNLFSVPDSGEGAFPDYGMPATKFFICPGGRSTGNHYGSQSGNAYGR